MYASLAKELRKYLATVQAEKYL